MKISSGKISYNGYTVRFAGGSDTGKKRGHNEDSFALLPEAKIFCVADGVGGMDAGEVASKRAVDHIVNHSIDNKKQHASFVSKIFNFVGLRKNEPSANLLEIIDKANKDVYALTKELNKKMATTMVALQLDHSQVVIGSVGDSRAYLLRNNILGQVTIDHTLAMNLMLAGLSTNNSKLSEHTITRAIGSQPSVEIDNNVVDIRPGDVFLLCSDGLTDMLSDKIICTTTNKHKNNIYTVVQELINGANESGGRDNVTVVAMMIDSVLPHKGLT